jgi:hypothetical protein
MSKDESPTFYMTRKGAALYPEMGIDADLLQRLPSGTRIKVKVSEGRSPPRLRLYWAYLGRVVAATQCAPTSEALHAAVKIGVGLVTPVMLKGWSVNVPRSVSFDKMSETEFSEFLQSAEAWIIENFGVSIADAFNGGAG